MGHPFHSGNAEGGRYRWNIMATKRSRRNVKAVPTPRAPLNLKINRRTAQHSVKGMPDDELARERGEEYIRSVTGGGNAGDELLEEEVIEEHGGPFITTSAATEFADGTDGSNPEDAEPQASPIVSPLRQK